jgi:DNA-directed RNA polymerase subunit RPC12/RpoP
MERSVKHCSWCSKELNTKVVGDKVVCAYCGFKVRTLPKPVVVAKEQPKPLLVMPVEIPEVQERPKWPLYVAIGLGVIIVVLLVRFFS